MKLRNFAFFLSIALLALILRFYLLGDVPNGFHRDEVFLGYNAYSILTTGKDINGYFLPTHLASFLYTPAGYSYFSIPFIALFGLSEFSIRFASAFFGFLTIILFYFVAKLIFEKMFSIRHNPGIEAASLLSSFMLAISPWHINLSRTASTSTLVLFFILLGSYFYIRWANASKILFLFLSYTSFFISLFFYISPYSFIPLFLPILFLVCGRRKIRLQIILFTVLIIFPLVYTLLSPNLSLRARSIGFIGSEGQRLMSIEKIGEDGVAGVSPFVSRVFHNKLIIYSNIFFANYFQHLSYDFLFSDKGFPDRYRIPSSGLLYLVELPLLVLGVIVIASSKKKYAYLLLGWVLISPIGSSLAFDDIPNLQRILFILPPIVLINAYAIIWIWDNIPIGNNVKKIIFLAGGFAVSYFFAFYIHEYYIHGNVYRPWYRQEGYKELVNKVHLLEKKYDKIVVTNRESGPALFFVFYLKYSPLKFQQEANKTLISDPGRIPFGKYEFSEEECPLREEIGENGILINSGEENVLYVNSGLCKLTEKIKLVDTINRSDGSKAFYIVEK